MRFFVRLRIEHGENICENFYSPNIFSEVVPGYRFSVELTEFITHIYVSANLDKNVEDPRSRILIFIHPGNNNNNKRGGGRKLVVLPFLVDTSFTLKIILF